MVTVAVMAVTMMIAVMAHWLTTVANALTAAAAVVISSVSNVSMRGM